MTSAATQSRLIVRVHRPNNRPNIEMYPKTYADATLCVAYFVREYENSTVKIIVRKR